MGSSSLGYSPLFALGGFMVFVLFVAFVGTIVLTVLGYKRFVKTGTVPVFRLRDQATWGPYLRFETMVVDKVLIIFYLLTATSLALYPAAIVINGLVAFFASFGSGAEGVMFGGFMGTLLLQVCVFLLGELIARVSFELQMLLVVIARNTTALKRKLVDGVDTPYGSFGADTAPIAAPAAAPAPAPAAAPAEPLSAAAPAICPKCGEPLNPGDKFCGACGTRL